MKTNLNLLHNNVKDELNFEGNLPYNESRLKEFGILDLKCEFQLDLYKYGDDIRVNAYYEGEMETISGKSSFKNAFDEDLKTLLDGILPEILDIYEFLWQNIILEVPLV